MGVLFDRLKQDIRFEEGLKACINCGTCSAICAAAEFYDYDPRQLTDTVQSKDEEAIEALLKSDTIWYCGECMSCKTRCPRGNTPGLIVMALRGLSQELGYFVESEKGRQQLALKRMVGETVLKTGYCVHTSHMNTQVFPEQGPIWDWVSANRKEVYNRLGANYDGQGPGVLRKIPQESLDEIAAIFDETGATKRFEKIENFSEDKAMELGLKFNKTMNCEYFEYLFTGNYPEEI
jgi:heterodisulfide reductase subunit C1